LGYINQSTSLDGGMIRHLALTYKIHGMLISDSAKDGGMHHSILCQTQQSCILWDHLVGKDKSHVTGSKLLLIAQGCKQTEHSHWKLDLGATSSGSCKPMETT